MTVWLVVLPNEAEKNSGIQGRGGRQVQVRQFRQAYQIGQSPVKGHSLGVILGSLVSSD
jgi:hypothetical protein